MRANEYQTRAMSTRLPSCENATYMLFGLMAEVGEIADKIASRRERGVIDSNGDKSDNRRDNLVCFPKAEHTRRHQIERKKNDTHRSIFGNRRVCPRRALGRMEDARYL